MKIVIIGGTGLIGRKLADKLQSGGNQVVAVSPSTGVRSKINDAPEHVYKVGESWTEVPGDHHEVSAYASSTKPARLLAIFVVDTAEKELVIPDK